MTFAAAPDSPRRRGPVVGFALACCAAGLALPLIGRVLSPTANTFTWLLDLAAHWQPLYALGWLALCLLCARRAWRWLLLTPLALLPLFTASSPLARTDGGKPALVVAAANVYFGNRDPAPLVAWLRAQPADVVMLSELSPPYAEALATALGGDYRFRILHPKDSAFGIGIVSRLPLQQIALIDDADGIQTLIAEVRIGRQPVRVIAAHPMPPLGPEWHSKRNRLLSTLARQAGRTPTVVAGDLNATPWSSALTGATHDGLFRVTGRLPTWPQWGHGIFGIPIDHVLATTHFTRGESSRGPAIGSDHIPVRATLHWLDAHDVD